MATIVFVNPPITLKERYGSFSSAGNTLPSYGLCLLAAVVREKGYRPAIVEAASQGLSYRQTVSRILKHQPQYVGITATTVSIFPAAKLAKMLKKRDKKLTIIIGGPHITAVPEETLKKIPQFDIAVLGEGEETILELLKTLETKGELTKVSGIVFRKEKKLIKTGRRPPVKNLDLLPIPAWDLLPGFPRDYHPTPQRLRKFPTAMLLTSRGCPNQCIFCDRSVFGHFCRSHSPEYILNLIKILYNQYGVREILFEDDMFFIFKDKVKELCRLLIKEKLDLSWSCAGRVNAVDGEMLQLLKKAGCWYISYGIETGDTEILKLIQKNITLKQVKKAVELTRKAGILAKGFFILGHPKETEETLKKTIEFAKKLPLSDASFFKMTPLPGSELYRLAKEYGRFDNDWRKMNLLETVFVPFGLTKEKLERYEKQAFREFYLRPRILFSYLTRMLSDRYVALQIIRASIAFLKTTL